MKSLTLTRGVALCGALMLLPAPAALAASFESTPLHLKASSATHHAASGSASGSIARTIIGLALVIALIYGLAWVMRKVKASKNPATGAGLEQVASLPLGTNRSVSLVRVGSELHLLGVAESGVTTIRTYTEDEALEAGLWSGPEEDEFADPAQPGFIRAVDALRRMTIR
jgi:flagellar protein FliO/FliZ